MKTSGAIAGAVIVAAASLLATPSLAQQKPARAILVLDASGSMWGQIEGRSKIEIAREVIGDLMSQWESSVHLGLIAYGHRRKGDCEDIEALVPVGPVDAAEFQSVVDKLNPKGKTPLGAAVRQAAEALRYTEETSSVILISDGIETCDVDPCALGEELEARGVGFTVHVVGFDIKKDEQAELRCLAENTGGKFLSADSASELTTALVEVAEITKHIPKKKPAPPPATSTLLFEDHFNGEALAAHWELVNPDTEAYLVEDGAMLVIYQDEATIEQGNVPNLAGLNLELPKGNWRATIRLLPEFQTLRESIYFGIHQDRTEFMLANLYVNSWCCYARNLALKAVKDSKGKKTEFVEALAGTDANLGQGRFDAYRKHYRSLGEAILLRLAKKGRSYVFSGRIDGKDANGKPYPWVSVPKLTTLRPKGRLVFGFTQGKGGGGHVGKGGESLARVDWFKVEKPE